MKLSLGQSRWIGSVILLAGILLPAAPARATGIEITPVIGFRGGGQFSEKTSADQMKFDEGPVAGLILAFDMDGRSFIELSFMHQQTEMFPKRDGSPLTSFDKVYINDVQLGGHYMWEKKGPFKPFIRGSLGFTQFDPASPDTDDEINFSFALGGGAKTYFSKHIGLRLDGRALFSTLGSGEQFCTSTCMDVSGTIVLQIEATVGLIFAF